MVQIFTTNAHSQRYEQTFIGLRELVGTIAMEFSIRVITGDIGAYIDLLKNLKAGVDENTVPTINWKEIRPFLAMEHFTVEVIQSKNSAAAGVCSFVLNIVTVSIRGSSLR